MSNQDKYIKLLEKLRAMRSKNGSADNRQDDDLCDEMDNLWHKLTLKERKEINFPTPKTIIKLIEPKYTEYAANALEEITRAYELFKPKEFLSWFESNKLRFNRLVMNNERRNLIKRKQNA